MDYSVILSNIAVRLLEQLLICMQLVFEQRLPESLLDFPLPGSIVSVSFSDVITGDFVSLESSSKSSSKKI